MSEEQDQIRPGDPLYWDPETGKLGKLQPLLHATDLRYYPSTMIHGHVLPVFVSIRCWNSGCCRPPW